MKINNFVKRMILAKLKQIAKRYLFFKKYGFVPPPSFSDMSGYDPLLDLIIQQRIYQLEGDFVEIGVFLGGGTYKLSKLLERLGVNKKVYAIDIFNPEFDITINIQGNAMSEIYKRALNAKNQYDIYREIIKNCPNIHTIVGDSKKIFLPCEKIAFTFIDGNHSPDYVKNDFYLVWDKLVSKGVVAFDDYGYDIPHVTQAINQLIEENSCHISKVWNDGLKTIFIQKQ